VNQKRLVAHHGQVLTAALASLFFAAGPAPLYAATQEQERQEDIEEQQQESEDTPAPTDIIPRFTDQVVVSASRVEQEIVNAPAAIAVISAEVIETQAASNFGDLLRQAPGVNVTQLSSTHYSVTSRGSSSALATSQLVLVDGRSVYQDFFGFTSWDFLSVGLDDLERIEVVNGPASAVWGANAMSGVVNLITKAPRDTLGTSLNLRFGSFDRNVSGNAMDPGSQLMGSLTHAQALNDRFAYRATVSFSHVDPLPRPFGEIPNDTGTLYPPLAGVTAKMPKVDFRADWDSPDRQGGLRFSGGYAGSTGILHSGIGPFNVQSGASMSYGRVQYMRGSMEIGAFLNRTSASFDSLLSRVPTGELLDGTIDTNTYDISIKDTRFLGERHLFSYGASARFVTLDFTLAPAGDGRSEQGLYVSDEIFINDRWRWIVGARADRISIFDKIVLSPRTTLIFKPTPTQSIRVSYNRAFRAPSLSNTFLDTTIGEPALFDLRPVFRGFFGALSIPDSALPAPVDYTIPIGVVGNPALVQETLTAYEVGWSGALNDWLGASASVYLNDMKDSIDFTDTAFWSGENPPPGWNEAFAEVGDFIGRLAGVLPPGTLPPAIAAIAVNPAYLIDALGELAGAQLPAAFSYVNRVSVRNSGIELGLTGRRGRFGGFLNYSWQAEPVVEGFGAEDADEISIPAAQRINAGLDAEFGAVDLGLALNYTDRAYWTDVLTAEYHGWTEAFTMVNATLAVNLMDGSFQPSVRVINLLNQEIQNHVFGDVLRRQVIGGLRYRF
jgi:outer membrane receptor protein involved in Fe transport